MVHLGDALHLGRFVRVARADLKAEVEPAPPVEPLVWGDDQLEVEQVVRVRELGATGFGQLQLGDVLGDSQLGGALVGAQVREGRGEDDLIIINI